MLITRNDDGYFGLIMNLFGFFTLRLGVFALNPDWFCLMFYGTRNPNPNCATSKLRVGLTND